MHKCLLTNSVKAFMYAQVNGESRQKMKRYFTRRGRRGRRRTSEENDEATDRKEGRRGVRMVLKMVNREEISVVKERGSRKCNGRRVKTSLNQ